MPDRCAQVAARPQKPLETTVPCMHARAHTIMHTFTHVRLCSMVVSSGFYTCNLCGARFDNGERWACAACGIIAPHVRVCLCVCACACEHVRRACMCVGACMCACVHVRARACACVKRTLVHAHTRRRRLLFRMSASARRRGPCGAPRRGAKEAAVG